MAAYFSIDRLLRERAMERDVALWLIEVAVLSRCYAARIGGTNLD